MISEYLHSIGRLPASALAFWQVNVLTARLQLSARTRIDSGQLSIANHVDGYDAATLIDLIVFQNTCSFDRDEGRHGCGFDPERDALFAVHGPVRRDCGPRGVSDRLTPCLAGNA